MVGSLLALIVNPWGPSGPPLGPFRGPSEPYFNLSQEARLFVTGCGCVVGGLLALLVRILPLSKHNKLEPQPPNGQAGVTDAKDTHAESQGVERGAR